MPERLSGLFNSIQFQLRPNEGAVPPTDQEIMLHELHKMGYPHMTLADLTSEQPPPEPILPFEERLAQIQAKWEVNPPKFDRVASRRLTLAQMREQQQELAREADTYMELLLPAISMLHVGAFQPA